MKGLDTNVLVRYLVQDAPEQGEQAAAYIREIKASGETCFINNIVLCELVWVLKSAYKLSRDEIIATLELILRADTFEFENKSAASCAVQQMKQGKADFSDYLIGKVNQQAGCTETASFDAKLKSAEGFHSL